MAMPLLRFKRDDGSDYPEWKEDTLKGLGTFIRGLSYSANLETDDTSKTLVLRANNIISDGFVDLKNNVKYVDKIPKNEQILLKGDIAIATTSSPGIVGKTALYNSVYDGNITVGAFCCIYRSCNSIMPYVLRSPRYKYLSNISMADSVGGFRNLYISNLEAMTFFVPSSLEEQQKIADFLSDIDNQIENYQQSLDNLESQKKELLRQVFSQELRFRKEDGSEYPDWEEKKINDFADIQMCKRVLKKQTTDNGEIPFYKIGTLGSVPDAFISRSLFEDYKSRYKYPKVGEVMMTCSGTIGKCIIFDGHDSYYQDSNIVWLRNNDDSILNKYIYYCINYYGCNASSTDGIINRLYAKDLKNIRFNFPCSEEQQKIADFFSDFDERIELERQRLQTMQQLKKGLLQQMFC